MTTTSTNQITVIDNFLSTYDFTLLQKLLFSEEITWEFGSKVDTKDGSSKNDLANYQFVHIFLAPLDILKVSPHADKLNIFMEKLGIESILRIKANLEGWKSEPYYSGFHVDTETGKDTCLARTANNVF